jgi:hypothetical protein
LWFAFAIDILSDPSLPISKEGRRDGKGCSASVSIGVAWSGNVFLRHSRRVRTAWLGEEVARRMAEWMGLVSSRSHARVRMSINQSTTCETSSFNSHARCRHRRASGLCPCRSSPCTARTRPRDGARSRSPSPGTLNPLRIPSPTRLVTAQSPNTPCKPSPSSTPQPKKQSNTSTLPPPKQ